MEKEFSNWKKRYFTFAMNPTILRNVQEKDQDKIFLLLDDAWDLLTKYKKNSAKNSKKEKKMKVHPGRKTKLVKGKKASSPKGFQKNIKREKELGRKTKQAVKVAYVEAEKGKKK